MRVVTDIIAEEYTPQGTRSVLRIEDIDIDELLKGKLAKLRPWDLLYLHFLNKNASVRDIYTLSAKQADAAMVEREKRFPMQVQIDSRIGEK